MDIIDRMLFAYQKEGIDFLVNHDRALLADEMGLGKSCQVLRAAQEKAESVNKGLRVLIVCPASLRLNWLNEIKLWITCDYEVRILGTHTVKHVHSAKRRHLNIIHGEAEKGSLIFYIASYSYFQREKNAITAANFKFNIAICDESHNLKSWTAQQTRNFIFKVGVKIPILWLMSGHPATKNAADYHPQLSVIQPGKWGNFAKFCEEFTNAEYNPWSQGVEYKGFRNGDILNRKIFSETANNRALGLRRLKRHVQPQLPPKIYTTIPVTLSADIIEESKSVDAKVLRRIIQSDGMGAGEELATLRRAIGVGKIDAAVTWVKEYTAGEPLVIFAWHVQVVEGITKRLKEEGYKVGSIKGGDTDEKRNKVVEDFRDAKLDIVVLSIAAAGVGLNFTRASHMLMVELAWSPALMLQAEDRSHRIGQKADCLNIYKMIAVDSIDETISDLLVYKLDGMRKVLGDNYAIN